GQSCFKINLTSFGNEAIIEHHFLFVRGQNTAFCPFFPSLNLTFNTSVVEQVHPGDNPEVFGFLTMLVVIK
ncbi:hypothetical protein, partial [Trichothermofontia sp.]